MQTKLTLRLEDHLIDRAKVLARRTGKSVSQMVADYFAALDAPEGLDNEDLPPLTQALYGALAGATLDETDYHRYLEAKYQ